MGKKRRERSGPQDSTDWSTERTLADAEADAELAADEEALQGAPGLDTPYENPRIAAAGPAATSPAASGTAARCACGSEEFLLEAYLAVIRGRPQPEPVELEALTCPQCGREYEAIWLADGSIARGDYLGQTALDD